MLWDCCSAAEDGIASHQHHRYYGLCDVALSQYYMLVVVLTTCVVIPIIITCYNQLRSLTVNLLLQLQILLLFHGYLLFHLTNSTVDELNFGGAFVGGFAVGVEGWRGGALIEDKGVD